VTLPSHRRGTAWLAAGLCAAAAATALLVAPADAVQGQAQRLMYLHVPAAWTAYLAFGVVLVASLGYLITRDPRWDRCARPAAEIGVGLTAFTILAGALWGHAVWGVWWAWEPRLVSTLLLLLVYTGYLAARRLARPPARHTARTAAIVGIAGFALIPVVHFSVVWWRSLHQPATILGTERPPIDPLMAATLGLSVLAFTTGALWLFLRRLDTLTRRAGAEVHAAGGGFGGDPAPEPAPADLVAARGRP
jgi:heme exporter protein C